MPSMRDISNSVRRNQGSITAAQYLAGASSLLIPSRSKHYEVYTEASYCLSQLITFCNSVFLDNLYVDENLRNVQNRAGGGVEETTRTDSNSLLASTVIENRVCNNRGLDYYLWVTTRLVTHVEVLLEKAAGAFWGENSKERSLLILTIESIKAINRLFALLSSSNGKHTMILNWSKTYSSASDILDLSHYKLWYKVQNDRIHEEKIRAKLVLKGSKKEEIGIERDLFRREKFPLSSTTIDMNQETLFCTQFVGRRSGMVLNYSSGDEVIAALPSSSSSSSSSSPNATSTSSSALSSSLSTFEGSETAVRTPTVFTSCPLSPASPTASISPSPPSPSPPFLPSPTTSSPASPCESFSHSPHSSSSSSTPTISSPSIPTIQEESASLLVSYYNATTCFPSSSSGITDDESTISTDSGTDNAEIRTNGDINQNGDNNDNNEDLSHLRNDDFDESKNGNIHNNLYAISTIPLQNTIYNNYCTKYDIVSDTSYDNLKGKFNINNDISKYDGKAITNKRKNKNKYQNKQTNVACNTNDSRSTTNKQKEKKDECEIETENDFNDKTQEKCEMEESKEGGHSSECSRTQWCVSTPQKCQDIYTSLTHSHDMGCEDEFSESSKTSCSSSSSSSSSSNSSSSTAVDIRHVVASEREGDKETYDEINIDDNNEEKVKHCMSYLTLPSSIATSTSDIVDETNIDDNDDINKSTQTERVYVFKSHRNIQNSNINSIMIKQKNTTEYPFTMEQALLVAEVLYVLRPVVYAWTVHYIQERKRKRSCNSEDELNSIINNVGAGVGAGTGGILGGIRPSDSVNSDPSSTVRSGDASTPGKRGSGSDDQADEENSFFSSLEDFLPLLLSLILEVSSIKLTCIALSMARESDKEEGQKEEDDDEGEVEEDVINGKRNQHNNKSSNNKNGHNTAAYDSTSTQSCLKGPTKSPLNNPQRSKTTKYTQHKWDSELSRRKLLLLYYLVRGRTFNRATLPLLRSASELLRFIPIINSLPSYAISMLSYLNRSHFRSSSSS